MTSQMQSLAAVRRLAGAELSLAARLGYVALLLASTAMTAVVASLWLTEPSLPARTQWAFGGMTLIGASWVTLAIWALGARRPLFARDRLIAARMAVAFTAAFTGVGLVAGLITGHAAPIAMLTSGVIMLLLALRAWSSARRRVAELQARLAKLPGN